MNQPHTPVRPPAPPPVPKDHIPDAGKMVETPRTDAVKRCDQNGWIVVPVEVAWELERELTAANAEVARLKGKVEYLQNWIRRLAVIEANPTEYRRWCGEIGWLYPGQCAYVGPQKPENLR